VGSDTTVSTSVEGFNTSPIIPTVPVEGSADEATVAGISFVEKTSPELAGILRLFLLGTPEAPYTFLQSQIWQCGRSHYTINK
jgi:hypothetical protein